MKVLTEEPESPFSNVTRQEQHEDIHDPNVEKRLVIEMYAFIQKVINSVPMSDVLVFLDKSARPAAWLFENIWKNTYPSILMPEIKTVNIGKEKTGDFDGMYVSEREINRYIDKARNRKNMIQELRETFSVKNREGVNLEKTHF